MITCDVVCINADIGQICREISRKINMINTNTNIYIQFKYSILVRKIKKLKI